MNPRLNDVRQFVRFALVSVLGTVADYGLSVFLVMALQFEYVLASAIGFSLGALINYCGHNIFSYKNSSAKTISLRGFGKYYSAVILSLFVRLAIVFLLSLWGDLPYWLIQIVAIGVSFVASYVISTLWVFAGHKDKPDSAT